MKKANKKGFTLVELIVVSTMMVIILGAILNLIEPINNFYKNVQSTANSNDIGNLTMKYLESELRYSTEVLILEDFTGVPVVQNGFIQKTDGSDIYNQYTDCLIVENNPTVVRGAINGAIPGDVSDMSVARRKGAFGQLYKVHLDDVTGTLEPSAIEVALGEDVYDDYSYQYTIRGPQTSNTSNKVLDVEMRVFKPEYDSKTIDANTGTHYYYELGAPAFTQRRTLELLNINQIKRGYVLYYFSNSPDVDGVQPIPTDIKKESSGFGDAWEESLYGGVTPHTYIFYRKDPDTTVSTNVTIRLLETGDTYTLTKGQPIPPDLGKGVGSTPDSWYLKPYGGRQPADAHGNVYDMQIAEIKDEATGRTLQDMIDSAVPIDFDTNFTIVPGYVLVASPIGSVNFYNTKDEYDNGVAPSGVRYFYAPNPSGDPTSVSLSDFPTLPPLGEPRGKRFVRWIDASGAALASTYTSGNHYFYPEFTDLPRVYYVFYDESGNEVANFKDSNYILEGETDSQNITPAEYPDLPGGPSDPDKIFVGWKNKSYSPHKFPKPGGLLAPRYYPTVGSDLKVEFEPDLIDKGRAFNVAAIIGSGDSEGHTQAIRDIYIGNSGDTDSAEEITVTITSPVEITSALAYGQGVYTHGWLSTGSGYDSRVYVIKYNGTIRAGEQRFFTFEITTAEACDFSKLEVTVTTPEPETSEDEGEGEGEGEGES